MFRALSMNEIYSNGLKLYPFSGHSGFKVIHWETIVMKVHTLHGPLCYIISNIGYVAHNLCNVPS